MVSTGVKDRSNDGGDDVVDEHRQHSTILEQLQHLKSVATVRLVLAGRNYCPVFGAHANVDDSCLETP